MNYLSVCSGIEAATVAWEPIGWKAFGYSEIEKFPSAVLNYRHPTVKNYGDMTKFKEWPDGKFNILVGGTPCQSFSVAGLRKGLADPRGNLALVYLAIADRYRPDWVVWENVPGVLSSSGGRDFGAFLGGLAELGYGWAYRVLDAQYLGLAQRRKRVFVVGYFGDWRRAAAVLFERNGLSWNPPPSRKAGQGTTRAFETGPHGGGFTDLAPTLDARAKDGPIRNQLGMGVAHITHSLRAAYDASEDGTGRGTPVIPIQEVGARESKNQNGVGIGAGGDVMSTLQAGQVHGVAFAQNTRDEVREMVVAGALAAEPGAKQQSYLRQGMAVRRLTPRECERLQGFPDDYTLIPFRRNPAKDGPRYKALGNSMAVPVMRWIGQRIESVAQIKEVA